MTQVKAHAEAREVRPGKSLVFSAHVASVLLATPNAVALAQRLWGIPWRAQLTVQGANLGQALACAWLLGGSAALGSRWLATRPRLTLALLSVLSLLLGALHLPGDFASFADRLRGTCPPIVTQALLTSVASLSVPLLLAVGWVLAKTRWRWLGIFAALALSAPNNFVLVGNYPGLHGLLTLAATALCWGSLLELGLPNWSRLSGSRSKLNAAHLLAVASAVAAIAGILGSPAGSRQELARLDGAPLGGVVARAHTAAQQRKTRELALSALTPAERPWFSVREGLPPVPAHLPSLLPADSLVILVTIDALRADVTRSVDPQHYPFINWLNREAVNFTQARAPGTGTVPTLTSLFSGRYFSQIWWERRGGGTEWPHNDKEVRFPELLLAHGVNTLTFTPLLWLVNDYRIGAGFAEEKTLDRERPDRGNHILSNQLLPVIQERLARGVSGPNLLVFHLMDCHAPYNSGRVTTGPAKKRYLGELERVDGELAAFRDFLAQQPYGDRITWIVSADHGEAFGEHGTEQHVATVYDELLRVPLWIKIPGVAPRVSTTPVSLIDVGPTLLDLFGVQTPATFMGESLVPELRGTSTKFTRPIAAETRLRQTIVFADGMKAIRDLNNGGRELYDLKTDPGERHNLVERGDPKYLALVDLFFDTQQNPRYEKHAPYRQ